LVNVSINLIIDIFSLSLFSISDQRMWMDGLFELLDGKFVSLEFLWPFSVSGGFESSFLFTDRVLVVNPIFLKLLLGHDIVSLSSSVVIDNGALVINLKSPFTGCLILDKVEVF